MIISIDQVQKKNNKKKSRNELIIRKVNQYKNKEKNKKKKNKNHKDILITNYEILFYGKSRYI